MDEALWRSKTIDLVASFERPLPVCPKCNRSPDENHTIANRSFLRLNARAAGSCSSGRKHPPRQNA